jgi:hypothetical protein
MTRQFKLSKPFNKTHLQMDNERGRGGTTNGEEECSGAAVVRRDGGDCSSTVGSVR